MIGLICDICKVRPAMHRIVGVKNLCCKCWIESGEIPAGWHSECMKLYKKIHTLPARSF